MRYRTATPADEPALHALWAAVFPDPATVVALWSRDPGRHSRTFIAEDGAGRPVSVVHYLPRPIRSATGRAQRVGCLGSVATLPDARGRGHVRHLLAAAVAAMTADACAWSLLFTGTPRVYEGAGWRTFPAPGWTGPLAEPSLTDPPRTDPSRPGPSRTDPSHPGPSCTGPSCAGPSCAGLSCTEPSHAGPSCADPSRAGPSHAGPSCTEPSHAGPSCTGVPPGGIPSTEAGPVSVRAAVPADVPALRALRDGFDAARPLTTVRGTDDWLHRIPVRYAAPAETLIAHAAGPSGDPLGFVVLRRPHPGGAELAEIALALGRDGDEAAAALLSAAAVRARAAGATAGTVHLPGEPAVLAALPRFLARPSPATTFYGMARPLLSPSAEVTATVTAPGAVHWYGDSF